jgi:hypothetical protein
MRQAGSNEVVDLLLEGVVEFLPAAFDCNGNVVVESEGGTHTSKHNMDDVVMSDPSSPLLCAWRYRSVTLIPEIKRCY